MGALGDGLLGLVFNLHLFCAWENVGIEIEVEVEGEGGVELPSYTYICTLICDPILKRAGSRGCRFLPAQGPGSPPQEFFRIAVCTSVSCGGDLISVGRS